MKFSKTLVLSTVVIVFLILLEVFFVHPHAYYWWHGLIGFDVIFGFFGCLILIVVSKGLGKLFIQGNEDYYQGGDE